MALLLIYWAPKSSPYDKSYVTTCLCLKQKFDRRRVGRACCTYIPSSMFTKLALDVPWANPKLCTKFHGSMTTRSFKMPLGGDRAMAATGHVPLRG